MYKITAFSDKELRLVDKSEEILQNSGKDIYATFMNQKKTLISLAVLVSKTPSLKSRKRYGLNKRDIKTMSNTIIQFSTSNPLLLPTRAIMGRSFILSKINFFYFLLKVISDYKTDSVLVNEIQNTCNSLVFSLMAEETYEAIIKNNVTHRKFKQIASDELAHLWEFRMDRNLDSFSPPLMALWKERCNLIPVLGTLQGTSEILKLSINLSETWGKFLSSAPGNAGLESALEEFVFGLKHEEIKHLRSRMKSLKIPAVNREQSIEILKKDKIYEEKHKIFINGDAREIYSFFQMRLGNTVKREIKNTEGPRQTIEELFLIYLLNQKKSILPGVIKKSISRVFSDA